MSDESNDLVSLAVPSALACSVTAVTDGFFGSPTALANHVRTRNTT
jgi:hypothetical protein